MSRTITERLVLEFYPRAQILSQDQAMLYSEYYREFLRFMFESEILNQSDSSPEIVFLRGDVLGPRCLNFKNAPGLPNNTSVIVINLTLLEFLTQTLISITFKTIKEHGQEGFLKDSMARVCQFSWPEKFEDFHVANEFLRECQEFHDLTIEGDVLSLVQNMSSKITNSLRKESEDIGGFEPTWHDTISNQYFSIIFHMVLAHEYGHHVASRKDLQGPGFCRVSAKARMALDERETFDARLYEEVTCDFIGYENLLFQQGVFRIADWRIALATTWLEVLSATAGLIFRNRSFGSQSDRLNFKIHFFRTGAKPSLVSKCLRVHKDLSGLLLYVFLPKVAPLQRLLQQASKV